MTTPTPEQRDWSDDLPADMSDALRNIESALGQMLSAIDDGRYRFNPVHVRADLRYLRAEARRALRYRAAHD
jgi:hypothetical protein